MIVSHSPLGSYSAMVTHERTREVAILQALGATKGYVTRLMLAESFSLSIIGGLIGIGTAVLILVGFQDFIASALKIPFIIPSPLSILADGGIALFLAIVTGGIASFYHAYHVHIPRRSNPDGYMERRIMDTNHGVTKASSSKN